MDWGGGVPNITILLRATAAGLLMFPLFSSFLIFLELPLVTPLLHLRLEVRLSFCSICNSGIPFHDLAEALTACR